MSGIDEIMAAARATAMDRAYAPYSNFKVGAAVRGGSGRVCAGCRQKLRGFGAANLS